MILAIIMLLSTCIIANAAETKEITTGAITNATLPTLYAHGVKGNSDETEAWQKMQWNDNKSCNYFYLPSGADDETVEIYNNRTSDITIDSTKVPANSAILFSYSTDKTYQVNIDGKISTLKFMKSTAEAAVYINNSSAGKGKGLWQYLTENKSNEAKATGAIVDKDGTVDNTSIKKIKGRGNTTWYADKKPFNITYDEKVSIDGMEKGKKYSFLANFQDASLSRNRFLYDLSDEVGMPYASDSRYVDFYVDGEYKGSYQAAQKVDTGSGNLLGKIDEEQSYLNEDGTLAKDFAFVCEIDASAGDDDYTFRSETGNTITLKVPELSQGDKYYNEVLNHAREKFDAMFFAVEDNAENLDELIDVESLAKLYLINELGKNWDSGASSTFFTYKQDDDGNWKFFASPVWDYDNSLGNATGVQDDLRRMGVRDYTSPTGWWCEYKGKASHADNILSYAAKNPQVLTAAKKVWTLDFVPALKKFASTGVDEGELYSADVYYNYISGSADMNYTLGWRLNTGGWICDHSSLKLCTYDYKTCTYSQATTATKYDINTFKGEYDYTVDWMMSRAAWLSSHLYDPSYIPSVPEEVLVGDVDFDGDINVKDATLIQLYIANLSTLSNKAIEASDVDNSLSVDIKDATYIQLYCANINAEGSLVGTTKILAEASE
ncbi:MAG: CotH kinase family protein [Ruminococcus sp.]|nr:CotH kinase family protein [Ruminococcus sp.]